jgi:hypothetical protein
LDEIDSGEIQIEDYREVIQSPTYGYRLEWKKRL